MAAIEGNLDKSKNRTIVQLPQMIFGGKHELLRIDKVPGYVGCNHGRCSMCKTDTRLICTCMHRFCTNCFEKLLVKVQCKKDE